MPDGPGRPGGGSLTDPGSSVWRPRVQGFRASEHSALVGSGDAVWQRASHDLLRWRVKTASGFRVGDSRTVVAGRRVTITARVAGVTVIEPVEVAQVVHDPDRVGFSYRTLPGHPVDGEEAFTVHRDGDRVVLTVRSLTRAARRQPWRTLYPLLRVAQAVAHRRYLRSLA